MAEGLVTIKYVGRHGAVDFDPDGLGEISVVFGEHVSVPAAKAASLLLQRNNWTLAQTTPSSSKEVTK